MRPLPQQEPGEAASSDAVQRAAPVDLELRDVRKRFGRVTAVDGLSFTATKGEFISFLGPSGCGKTTALRLVAGYEQPDEGEILLRGRSLSGIPPYRRNVGMVFQNYALFPHLSVAENIAFGLKERRLRRDEIARKVSEIVRMVHLEGLDDRYPNQLSGGQQQRVALARALVIEPEILLLDEPLSNLDAKLREEMRLEIKQLQSSLGITTVFVTHDQHEALTLSQRVVLMADGRVKQIGTPEDVYRSPRTRFTFEFLGGTNVFSGRIERHSRGITTFATTSGLVIAAANPTGRKVEGVSCLGIRPENIRLVSEELSNGPNRFAGVIEEAFYRGWTQEILIRLAYGDRLRMVRIAPRAEQSSAMPTPGEAVEVEWLPEDCYLLSEA